MGRGLNNHTIEFAGVPWLPTPLPRRSPPSRIPVLCHLQNGNHFLHSWVGLMSTASPWHYRSLDAVGPRKGGAKVDKRVYNVVQ